MPVGLSCADYAARIRDAAISGLRWGLDVLLPPRCPVNGTIVDRPGAISPEAWRDLTFISDPKCACCGMPFPITVETDSVTSSSSSFSSSAAVLVCGACLASPRPYDAARSVFAYDDGAKPMILAFKHGDAVHLHTTLAPLLRSIGGDFLTPDAVLVPVPLHWGRLIKRRYNQAAILAQEVGKLAHVACWPDVLIRTRATPPQGHKNAKDRHKNVAGAFDMRPVYHGRITGKTCVLVDDVFTTGATLEECSKVLKANGAKHVYILTIARVVRG